MFTNEQNKNRNFAMESEIVWNARWLGWNARWMHRISIYILWLQQYESSFSIWIELSCAPDDSRSFVLFFFTFLTLILNNILPKTFVPDNTHPKCIFQDQNCIRHIASTVKYTALVQPTHSLACMYTYMHKLGHPDVGESVCLYAMNWW